MHDAVAGRSIVRHGPLSEEDKDWITSVVHAYVRGDVDDMDVCVLGVIILPIVINADCVHALKGLALPRVSHSGEIALSGSRRLRSTLAAAPVLFARAVVTAAKFGRIIVRKLYL